MEVVLIEPEIPQNTGSIARTCAATKTPLHLVGKLGFEISEKAVRRAGLDYWPHVKLQQHFSWADYLSTCQPKQTWFFSKFGERTYWEVDYDWNAALVFGRETEGLGKEFLSKQAPDQIVRIPVYCPEVRSLNLSNAVSIVLYEAIRQWKKDDRISRQYSEPTK